MAPLRGVGVVVAGGDDRETEVIKEFAAQGARVTVVARPERDRLAGVAATAGLAEAVTGQAVLCLPISGVAADGSIRCKFEPQIVVEASALARMEPEGLVVGGPIKSRALVERLKELGLRHLDLADDDELAVLNAVPTAEGAIQLAMAHLPVTIHGSKFAVLGLGRTGLTLARTLRALGAEVWGVARNGVQLARAKELTVHPTPWEGLGAMLGCLTGVFNTVPALVLDRRLLAACARECLIIDLASAPGGVDFAAAEELGIRAELALGLPGKVAPITAGRILAGILTARIRGHVRHLRLGAGS